MVHRGVVATPLRQRAREERRSLFMQAARRIVIAHGVDGLTMQRLAGELDCAVGAVYRYFPSKDALIAELQSEAIETLLAAYEETRAELDARLDPDDPQRAALTRLVAFVDFYAAVQAAHPEEFNLIMLGLTAPQTVIGDAELGRIAPAAVRFFGRLTQLLDEATTAGALEPGDSRERASLWATALLGTLMSHKLARYDPALFDAGRLGIELTAHLLTGWGADAIVIDGAVDRLAELTGVGEPVAPAGPLPRRKERSA